MLNESNNSDVADPLGWLQTYFNADIVNDAGYSVHVEREDDDAGITEMRVIIKRLGD
jgi:hypothetical protein